MWRLARSRVMKGLGLDEGTLPNVPGFGGRTRPSDSAREELEEYLRSPQARRPPEASPRSDPGNTAPQPPPPLPPHPYAHEYRLLGAPVGADLATVQRHWREKVRENHPDRFAGDPAAEARANEQLRRINAAYERLRGYLK